MARLVLPVLLLLAACGPGASGTKESDTGGGDVLPSDADGDGYDETVDCNDASSAIRPGAEELCNGLDDDCDDETDEADATGAPSWYVDADGDGWGDDDTETASCDAPAGHVGEGGDCDDTDPAYNPGAEEADCTDPADYNCDGSVGFADADGDGFAACLDCDDASADVYPQADETCNGADDDCDGSVDEDEAVDAREWYGDADADGFGDATDVVYACQEPSGYASESTDCDDARADVSPAGTELCDGFVDEDCDGSVDEDEAADAATWYADADGDGFGDTSVTTVACDAPVAYVTSALDCDDTRATVNPAVAETCGTAYDDDCDGVTNEQDAGLCVTYFEDGDGDGHGGTGSACWCDATSTYSAPSGDDCDDSRAAVSPSGTETCATTYDDDCDGDTNDLAAISCTTYYADVDADGYGGTSGACLCSATSAYSVTNSRDCDDAAATVSPAAVETCSTAADDDCNGSTDALDALSCTTWYYDADGDGYGDATLSACYCSATGSYSAVVGTDCDDGSSATYPGAAESCATSADDDCDGVTNELAASGCLTWYYDGDGDGYGAGTGACYCSATSTYTTTADDDCDDATSSTNPGEAETWYDGTDQDCDGESDYDQDGDGYTAEAYAGTDCDDTAATAYPGRSESSSDGIDNDCDDLIDETDSWHYSVVDSTGYTGYYAHVALDSSDTAYVSYLDDSDYLVYSTFTGSGWSTSTVYSSSSADIEAQAIAINSSDYPELLYYDADVDDLLFSYRTSTGLTRRTQDGDIETFSTSFAAEGFTDILVDPSGTTWIAYTDSYDEQLKYGYMSSTATTFTVANVTADSAEDNDLAYDASTGGIGIAYFDEDSEDAKYAYVSPAGVVSTSTIETSGDIGRHIALAFDSDGMPHVIYADNTSNRVRYAYWTGSAWSASTLRSYPSSSYTLEGNDIVFDSDDTLHAVYSIGYFTAYAGYYAQKSASGTWTSSSFGDTSDDVNDLSIVLDGDELPHVAYFDDNGNDAIYAYYY